jgi:quercetin dioxygenase-like cupin family protein
MHTRVSVRVLSLLFLSACGGADTPDTTPAGGYPDAVSADAAHYAVAFENGAIRVLRITYGAGETSVMHGHPESCAIALAGGEFTMHLPDGTTVEESLAPGEVECYPAGAHRPENTSASGGEVILVELKDGATAGTAAMPAEPPATEADPGHYTVEVDNAVYRLVRVRYGAGEASVMHRHPAHCIVYLSTARSVTFRLPDGETVDGPSGELGDVTCVDAASHLPTNTSDTPLEVMLIELKGRATAS